MIILKIVINWLKRDPEIKDTINEWDEYQTFCINYLNNIRGEFDKNKQ